MKKTTKAPKKPTTKIPPRDYRDELEVGAADAEILIGRKARSMTPGTGILPIMVGFSIGVFCCLLAIMCLADMGKVEVHPITVLPWIFFASAVLTAITVVVAIVKNL